MAKKKEMMVCPTEACPCPCWFSWTVLIVGVLYLFGDLFGPTNMLSWFANTFSWWTVVFVLFGLKKVCASMCR